MIELSSAALALLSVDRREQRVLEMNAVRVDDRRSIAESIA